MHSRIDELQQGQYEKVFFLFLNFFLISTLAHALPFDVFPKQGTQLPTTVPAGGTSTAYYTVQNNTRAYRNLNYVKYLPPNVTQITTGGTYPDTCGATFNLNGTRKSGDSCTLQLSISGAVDAEDPDPHHHLFVCFPEGLRLYGLFVSTDCLKI